MAAKYLFDDLSFADSFMIFRKSMNLSSPLITYGVFRQFVAHYFWFILKR